MRLYAGRRARHNRGLAFSLQFIILALVFNQGKPHRSPLHTNMGLLAALVAQTAFVLFSLFSDCTFNRWGEGVAGVERQRQFGQAQERPAWLDCLDVAQALEGLALSWTCRAHDGLEEVVLATLC